MDDRKLTVIVVPHGDLETRSYEIPYRRLRLGIILLAAVGLVAGIVLATWFPVFAQAARVPSLERQLDALQEKQAEVVKLAEALEEVEAQYERVRALLGADAPTQGMPPTLPPLRRDTAATPEEQAAQGVSLRGPASPRGYFTRTASRTPSAPPAGLTGSMGSTDQSAPLRQQSGAGHGGMAPDPLLFVRQP
jgi:hypothetical protein